MGGLATLKRRLRRSPTPLPWPRPPRPPVEGGGVLVTGASGLIGGLVVDGLSTSHQVHGLDMNPSDRTDVVVDMRRLAGVVAAFAGFDTIIDLAAVSDLNASWDQVYTNNLPATMNALEAARRAGARRVIFASSNRTMAFAEREEPYASILAGRYAGIDPTSYPRLTVQDPIRPDCPYGIGKALGEAAARYYAEEYGISVLCLRIGTVNREDRPTRARHFSTLLSHRDLVTLVRCCLAAPDSCRFGVYFGVSGNRWSVWDIENARAELGYEPLDDAERWREPARAATRRRTASVSRSGLDP